MVSATVIIVNFISGIIMINIPSYVLDENKEGFVPAVYYAVDVVLFFTAVVFCFAHFGVSEDSLSEFISVDPVGCLFYFLMMSAIVFCSKMVFLFILDIAHHIFAESGFTVPTEVYWILIIAVFLIFNITSCSMLVEERDLLPLIQRPQLPRQQPVAPAG